MAAANYLKSRSITADAKATIAINDNASSQAPGMLANYDAARRALAQAKSIDEVKQIRNEAEALKTYARLAKDRSLEADAAQIRVQAERRIGQMMAEQKETLGLAKGAAERGVGRRGKRGSPADPRSQKITLAEAGIDKHLADRARRLAKLSEGEFKELQLRYRHAIELGSGSSTVREILNTLAHDRIRAAAAKELEARMADPEQRRAMAIADGDAALAGIIDDEEETPSMVYEREQQRLERLIRENPSSLELPPTINCMAKIVASALWRLIALSRSRHSSITTDKYQHVVDTMLDRIEHLEAAIENTERDTSVDQRDGS